MSLYLGGLVTSKSIENLPDLLDLLVREGGEGGFINPGLTLFLNIARIPRITQSDLVVFNLSGASCMFRANGFTHIPQEIKNGKCLA